MGLEVVYSYMRISTRRVGQHQRFFVFIDPIISDLKSFIPHHTPSAVGYDAGNW